MCPIIEYERREARRRWVAHRKCARTMRELGNDQGYIQLRTEMRWLAAGRMTISAHRARAEASSSLECLVRRIEELERALRDCVSTYRDDEKEVLVTAERQEAWCEVLARGIAPNETEPTSEEIVPLQRMGRCVGDRVPLPEGDWGIVTHVDARGAKYDVYRAVRVGHGWMPAEHAPTDSSSPTESA